MDVRRVLLAAAVVAAVAACGNAGVGPSDLDTQPPAAPDLNRIEVIPPVPDGTARLVGDSGAVEGSALVRVVNTDATARGGEVVDAETDAAPNGSFEVQIPADLGDNLTITATDAAGNVSAPSITKSGPDLVPFTATEVGSLQLLSFGQEGAVALPFPSGSERYAVVAQSLNPSGTKFDLKITGGWGTRVEERQLAPTAAAGSRVPMETAIREVERRAWPLLAAAGPARGRRLTGAQVVGEKRTFFVVNKSGPLDIDDPDDFDEVTATLRFVDDHTLIYVDDRTPAANLPSSVIQVIGKRFDDEIYPTDRAAFGEESDVDNNGKVIILLTPTVNALNTEETVEEGVVQLGFFFGIDLGPTSLFPFSNEGEIFYAVIPDPDAEFSPADIPLDGIEELLSSIFAHEFEHMISANQHILVRGGQAEQVWLDEGLAHYAETLNGFPLQNRFRSALFLDDPQNTSLVGGEDTLERRGAAWLFVQHLVDRFGEQILGLLVQTRRTGIPNVEVAADRSMTFLFHEWSSALYLDGISPDPVFNFASFDLRTEFMLAKQQLNRPLGTYLDLVQRAVGVSTSATLTRELTGMAAAYHEVHATGAGTRPVVLSAQSGTNLQTAIVRIE